MKRKSAENGSIVFERDFYKQFKKKSQFHLS